MRYYVFIDETGEANINNPDPRYNIFVLCGVIFREDHYNDFDLALRKLKSKHFGSEDVILHSYTMRNKKGIFKIFQDDEILNNFYVDIGNIFTVHSYRVISCIVDKESYKKKYPNRNYAYEDSLTFLCERAMSCIGKGHKNQTLHFCLEKRGKSKDRDLKNEGFFVDDLDIQQAFSGYSSKVEQAKNVTELLLIEAQLTKNLYKTAVSRTEQKDFARNYDGADSANAFLNHGNYLAYGLAASTLWVLGIPHGFAVMHGKTRRGALIFDVADLIKDAIVLPWAFICAKEKMTEQEFRQQILQKFTEHKAMDFMFEQVKAIATNSSNCF